jgi:hypothetical protein
MRKRAQRLGHHRLSRGEEKIDGLDLGKHGMTVYPEFPSTPALLGHASPNWEMGSAMPHARAPGRLAKQTGAELLRR